VKREDAVKYVSHILDDSLNVQSGPVQDNDTLVGWQCGFEPLFVAVRSYLPGVKVNSQDAEEIALDYLEEIGWFGKNVRPADYVVLP
jgi:hypothetical protein